MAKIIRSATNYCHWRRRISRVGAVVIALAAVAFGSSSVSSARAKQHPQEPAATSRRQQAAGPIPAGNPAEGRDAFVNNCALCHGVDATGGEGPNIQQTPATLGDAAVRQIIMRGVPGTEMPGFFMMLNASEVSNIISYLRELANTATAGTVTGDPSKGQTLFKSSGCSACHMIEGEGGDVGPDLSRIGSMRGPAYLQKKLVDPGADLPTTGAEGDRGKWTRYLMFHAVTKTGQTVDGMRVGEDSFAIVLEDSQGNFHVFYKPNLQSLEKEPGKSLMPSYKGVLSAAQLNDLVAYLSTLKGHQ
jgi:cytochrome c oxidase cbb3-type subunit III